MLVRFAPLLRRIALVSLASLARDTLASLV